MYSPKRHPAQTACALREQTNSNVRKGITPAAKSETEQLRKEVPELKLQVSNLSTLKQTLCAQVTAHNDRAHNTRTRPFTGAFWNVNSSSGRMDPGDRRLMELFCNKHHIDVLLLQEKILLSADNLELNGMAVHRAVRDASHRGDGVAVADTSLPGSFISP